MARIYPSANKMAHPVAATKTNEGADIKKMNTAQLAERAQELGVDISECKNNAQRANLIIAALEVSDAEETDE